MLTVVGGCLVDAQRGRSKSVASHQRNATSGKLLAYLCGTRLSIAESLPSTQLLSLASDPNVSRIVLPMTHLTDALSIKADVLRS